MDSKSKLTLIIAVLMLTLWAPTIVLSAEQDREDTVNSIASAAISSLEMYRWSKLEDVYKLVHQATLGPGHLSVGWPDMLAYLKREWQDIEQLENPRVNDLLMEDLGGQYVRVNLVPFVEQGGEQDSLAMALYRSLTIPPDSSLLVDVWTETCDLMLAGDPTLANQIRVFTDLMIRDGWPSVHHSQRYAIEYQPHYRVLVRESADTLLARKNRNSE
jgi:hypothetical protein